MSLLVSANVGFDMQIQTNRSRFSVTGHSELQSLTDEATQMLTGLWGSFQHHFYALRMQISAISLVYRNFMVTEEEN